MQRYWNHAAQFWKEDRATALVKADSRWLRLQQSATRLRTSFRFSTVSSSVRIFGATSVMMVSASLVVGEFITVPRCRAFAVPDLHRAAPGKIISLYHARGGHAGADRREGGTSRLTSLSKSQANPAAAPCRRPARATSAGFTGVHQ